MTTSSVRKQVTPEQLKKIKGILASLPEPVLHDLIGFIRGVITVAREEKGNGRQAK